MRSSTLVKKSRERSKEIIDIPAMKERALDIENFPDYLPPVFIGKIPATRQYCRGWNSKRTKYCAFFAGGETDHHGEGRCKYHGGSTPIQTGTYSNITRDTLKSHLTRLLEQPDEDVVSLREELDMMRALVAKRIEEYDDLVDALMTWNALEAQEASIQGRKSRPQPIPQLSDLVGLLEKITVAKTKMFEQQNSDTISKKDFFRLQETMADAVSQKIKTLENVIGVDEVERIINEIGDSWLEIRL